MPDRFPITVTHRLQQRAQRQQHDRDGDRQGCPTLRPPVPRTRPVRPPAGAGDSLGTVHVRSRLEKAAAASTRKARMYAVPESVVNATCHAVTGS